MLLFFTEELGVEVENALEFKRFDVEKLLRTDLG